VALVFYGLILYYFFIISYISTLKLGKFLIVNFGYTIFRIFLDCREFSLKSGTDADIETALVNGTSWLAAQQDIVTIQQNLMIITLLAESLKSQLRGLV